MNALYKCRLCGSNWHTVVPQNFEGGRVYGLLEQHSMTHWHNCASTGPAYAHKAGLSDLIGLDKDPK